MDIRSIGRNQQGQVTDVGSRHRKNRVGAMRAAWASLAAIVRDSLAIEPGAVPELDTLAAPPITNTNKTAVGQIQVIL